MSTFKLNSTRLALLLCLAVPPLNAADSRAAGDPQEEKLIAVLKSDASRKEKADACRELARIGTKEAVPALAGLLGDADLSHMARYGLETIPDGSVDQALREALGRVHGRPLVGVIGSLGVRRDAAAVKPLSALLHDADADVAQAAARALGKIATPGAAQAIEAALPQAPEGNQVAFCEGLFRCAEAFAAKHEAKRAIAIYDHVRGLQVAHQVRTAAWRGAVLARGKAGLPLLVQALAGSDYALFATANRISQEMPGSPVTLALAAELEKPSIDRQTLLIQTLARRGDNKALPALFDAARKADPLVRVAAIRSLAQLGSPEGVPVLVELMGDGDHDVARAAQESLAALPGRETDTAVLALLVAAEPAKRITAIELMARRRMVADLPALLKATQDSDATVRVAALRKVGGLAKAGDLPTVLDLMAGAKSPEEIEATEQSLGVLCGASAADRGACVAALAARLPQAPTAQKCALLRVIASVGDASALKCVRGAVSETDAEVHATAIRALAGWGTPEAAPDLLELARGAGAGTDKLLCLRGYLGFASHSDLAAAQRLAMCRNAAGLVQSADEKKLLLAALGSIHSPEALPLVEPYLEDPGTRAEAGNAAVGIASAILQGGQAAKLAPQLVAPLEKVAQATANTTLGERAKSLLEKARAKAQGT